MRAFIAVIFSFLFLLTTMQQTAFYLVYKLNEKEITERYCINKEVKNSCCHGKCHLGKTIAKAEQDPKDPFSILNIKIKDTEIFYELPELTGQSLTQNEVSYITYYSPFISKGFTAHLLKPPAVSG